MHARLWKPLLLTSLTCAVLLAPSISEPASAQGRRGFGREPARQGVFTRQAQRGNQEPAYARGYADGYERGLADGRRGDRYDPAESREYRDGDRGYSDSYGSRDAYRNNYRAGFRQGYEDGYRDGTR